MPGPAAATSAMSRRGCLMFRGSTGTGLAHPRRKLPGSIKQISGTMMVPNRSICARGFMVRRPWVSRSNRRIYRRPTHGHIHAGPWQRAGAALCTRGTNSSCGKIVHGRRSIELREAPALDLNQEERPIQRAVLREGGRSRQRREVLLGGEIVADRLTRRRAFLNGLDHEFCRHHIPAWRTASADFGIVFCSARRNPARWGSGYRQKIRRRRPRRRWIDPPCGRSPGHSSHCCPGKGLSCRESSVERRSGRHPRPDRE